MLREIVVTESDTTVLSVDTLCLGSRLPLYLTESSVSNLVICSAVCQNP